LRIQEVRVRQMLLALVTTAVVCMPAAEVAAAQQPDGPPLEGPSVGAMGAVGLFGNIGAVRVSAPLHEKWGLDVTAGHVDGYASPTSSGLEGYNFGAQVRWHWHGRRQGGSSGYWLAGPLVQGMTQRTLVIFPGNDRRLRVERTANFTLQLGYGWDWLLKSGTRFGFELVTGGNEGGPNPYVNAFIVWGRPRK
jgi:hypothetical protein